MYSYMVAITIIQQNVASMNTYSQLLWVEMVKAISAINHADLKFKKVNKEQDA